MPEPSSTNLGSQQERKRNFAEEKLPSSSKRPRVASQDESKTYTRIATLKPTFTGVPYTFHTGLRDLIPATARITAALEPCKVTQHVERDRASRTVWKVTSFSALHKIADDAPWPQWDPVAVERQIANSSEYEYVARVRRYYARFSKYETPEEILVYRDETGICVPLPLLFPGMFPHDLKSIEALQLTMNSQGELLVSANLEDSGIHHYPVVENYLLGGCRKYSLDMITGTFLTDFADVPQPVDEALCPIPDTFDCQEAQIPGAGFILNLYDYQLRTLNWMQDVESQGPTTFYSPNIGRTPDGRYVDITTGEVTDSQPIHLSLRGGIIADKPGVGKTITSVALVHTRPFPRELEFYALNEDQRFVSKATLILAPNNICDQWAQEVTKCVGNSFKVIQIKGKPQYTQVTIKDILAADVVIVSYQFLVNQCYKGHKHSGRTLQNFKGKWDFSNPSEVRRFCDSKKGSFALTWMRFHRIIMDELHESQDKATAVKDQLRLMSADFIWGLTGTPRLEDSDTVMTFAEFLGCPPNWKYPATEACRYIRNRVRRNRPPPKFPPPAYSIQWIKQSMNELALYRSYMNRLSTVQQLMLCSHFHITEDAIRAAGQVNEEQPRPIEEVAAMVQHNRRMLIEAADKRIAVIVQQNEECEKEIKKIENDIEKAKARNNPVQALCKRKTDTENRISANSERIADIQREIAPVQSQYNFFENFVQGYLNKDDLSCAICFADEDEIKEKSLGVLPCGHVFCYECTQRLAGVENGVHVGYHWMRPKCPNCRNQFELYDVYKLEAAAFHRLNENDAASAEEDDLDISIFGSKIRDLVKYIREVTAADDRNRIIVFSQWSDLSALVSSALTSFGVGNVRLYRGWDQREKALKAFAAGLKGVEPEQSDKMDIDEECLSGSSSSSPAPASDISAGPSSASPVPPSTNSIKVLMLSATDSVSGLNLTNATHVIILHPFHHSAQGAYEIEGRDDYALHAEKQGIARAVRTGQKNSVQVVRFMVRETVEQRIWKKRVESGAVSEGGEVLA